MVRVEMNFGIVTCVDGRCCNVNPVLFDQAVHALEHAPGKFRRRFIALSNRYKTLIRQNNGGTLTTEQYQTGLAKINASLLATLHDYESALKGELPLGSSISRFLYPEVAISILGIVAFLWVSKNGSNTELAPLEEVCATHNRMIYVANFSPGDTDGFSNRLVGLLRPNVGQKGFQVAGAEFVDFKQANYLQTERLFHKHLVKLKIRYYLAFVPVFLDSPRAAPF